MNAIPKNVYQNAIKTVKTDRNKLKAKLLDQLNSNPADFEKSLDELLSKGKKNHPDYFWSPINFCLFKTPGSRLRRALKKARKDVQALDLNNYHCDFSEVIQARETISSDQTEAVTTPNEPKEKAQQNAKMQSQPNNIYYYISFIEAKLAAITAIDIYLAKAEIIQIIQGDLDKLRKIIAIIENLLGENQEITFTLEYQIDDLEAELALVKLIRQPVVMDKENITNPHQLVMQAEKIIPTLTKNVKELFIEKCHEQLQIRLSYAKYKDQIARTADSQTWKSRIILDFLKKFQASPNVPPALQQPKKALAQIINHTIDGKLLSEHRHLSLSQRALLAVEQEKKLLADDSSETTNDNAYLLKWFLAKVAQFFRKLINDSDLFFPETEKETYQKFIKDNICPTPFTSVLDLYHTDITGLPTPTPTLNK